MSKSSYQLELGALSSSSELLIAGSSRPGSLL